MQDEYGPPDVLKLRETDQPTVKDDEALVRVCYTQEDFTEGGRRYDLILDNVGNHPLAEVRRALTFDGTVVPNSGAHSGGGWIGPVGRVAKASISSMFVRQQGRPFLSLPNHQDLVALKELVESGKVAPVIDRTYPLSETAEAMAYVGEGHACGKVVLTVGRDKDS